MPGSVEPYTINVPESSIQRLKDKLAAASFADEVEFSDDEGYGAPLSTVKRLVARWREGFDWRAHEAALNQLPHYVTRVSVDGFGPGSFYEVVKILPLLTEPEQGLSFHVVAPSLPNFAFSDGVAGRGFSIPQYAETLHKVMLNLGYDQYVTQGGDWGFIITRLMGIQYPDHCLASHINYVGMVQPPTLAKSPLLYVQHAVQPYSRLEKQGLERSAWFRNEGYGYNMEQSTKPSTLGFALADSPVTLLAWIYEKLRDWTDAYPWADDEVLAWVSLYQFSSAGPAASVRIYYECRHAAVEHVSRGRTYVPRVLLGYSIFPRNLMVPPTIWCRSLGPVVFEKRHEAGGHFAAHEKPAELAADLRGHVRQRRGSRGGGTGLCIQERGKAVNSGTGDSASMLPLAAASTPHTSYTSNFVRLGAHVCGPVLARRCR